MDGFFERRGRSSGGWSIAIARANARGNRQITEDWDEAQKKLRERLQARDGNTLPLLRKGAQITFAQWADHFLEAFRSRQSGHRRRTFLTPGSLGISKPVLGRSCWWT